MKKTDTNVEAMNFDRVNANLTRSGLPTKEDLKYYKDTIGVNTIVNFCTKFNTEEEENNAKELGLNYVHLPWSAHFYNIFRLNYYKNIAKSFMLIADNPKNQPVHVHCFHGRERTGMMVAVYRITKDGYSFKQALNEMKEYGFKPHLHFTLVAFVYLFSVFFKLNKID